MKRMLMAGAGLIALATSAPTSAAPADPFQGPRIDVAFVLDTTGSMSGLIEGAKRQIWSIANEIMNTREQAQVRFAIIGFRDRGDQYVTRQFDLTEDIYGMYGNLLNFQAAGGGDRPESVNQALNEAVTQLSWTNEPDALRMVYLVGDSPPHLDYQNDVHYSRTLDLANQRDIIVNTVLAGNHSDTANIWREISRQGRGVYLEIPQDGGMQTIVTPYDDQITQLQQRIANTSIGYGSFEERAEAEGARDMIVSAAPSVAADMATNSYRSGRASGGAVFSGANDLVEDYANGEVELGTLDEESLPGEYASMSEDDLRATLETRAAEREALNVELAGLVEQRDNWMREERSRRAASGEDAGSAFDREVARSVREAAAERGIEYEDE